MGARPGGETQGAATAATGATTTPDRNSSTVPDLGAATLLVLGAGKMGLGLAELAVSRGHAVQIVEPDPASARRARERLATASPDGTAHSARVVGSLAECVPADMVVEAVPEDPVLKTEILRKAERLVADGGLLATNTSSLAVTEMAAALDRPERFCGMHFFQPVPTTPLLEVIRTPQTGDVAVATASAWARHLGKTEIRCADSPGFATSRLGVAIGLEAMRMVEEGIAPPEDIDTGMELGYRHGVGPLRMSDMVGLDVRLAIAEHLAATLGPRFEPPRILRDMVSAGQLGEKTGQGFFRWPHTPDPPTTAALTSEGGRPHD
ncbi:3-hydroxyacyl-CoA dehydrogenase family protein [Streptomyces sp. CB01580]|uniref:3-hydroxyacyl-CoA dehydrogenase family protein n=1 Tax=Streptomyces sp. CB01580 TaxID=1703933 RepID=UPI0009A0E5A4|nr:3-hydroxyacyl-CoA dehydrogenase family protein [Streptomyces sp. CB01580]